jgi:hypothetical protein
LREHQGDFFTMALYYKAPSDVAHIQNKKLLDGLDIPEIIAEKFKEINAKFSEKAQKVLANEVAGLEKRICLLLQIVRTGNESLLRIFENSNDFEGIEPWENVLSFESPDLEEGYLDLEAELLRLKILDETKEIGKELKEEESNELNSLDLLNQLETDEDAGFLELPDGKIDPFRSDGEKNDLEDLLTRDAAYESLDYRSRFVFRADSKNTLLHDLLSNAVFSHNFIILPLHKNGEELFAIYYRGNKSIGCVKVRETTTRLSARKEIGRIIKYLNQINRFTEGLHLVEHILLRPQAQDRHGFRLINDQDRILLESYVLGSFDDQRNICNQIDLIAIRHENYEIRQEADGTFALLLKDYDQYIARCPESFFTQEGASDKLDDILDYVNSFKNSSIALQNNISYFLEERREVKVDQDFYSLGMSVIMPAWPSRFQNSDFKTLLCNVFCVNAPVHLDINFYWLEHSEMEDFEKCYFSWLEERNTLYPQQPALDDKAMLVVDYLQKIK